MDNKTYTDICIFSYNSRGFGEDKQEIFKLLMLSDGKKLPIICAQEHFLLKNNAYKVKQALPNCHIFFKEAVMSNVIGRPKNGMFVAIPTEVKEHVVDVSPNHSRVQAVVLSTLKSKILIINTYFPTDPKTKDFDASELISTLNVIDEVIIATKFDHMVWGGDLNADFMRHTKFSCIVEDFINERGLQKSCDKHNIDYTHAAEVNGRTFTSTIDHFCWNEGLSNVVSDAGVLHLPLNLSDHSPIYCLLKIDSLSAHVRSQVIGDNKIHWNKASEDEKRNFVDHLENSMENLDQPNSFMCDNVHCGDTKHRDECDDILMALVTSLEKAAITCLPKSIGCKINDRKRSIPLWNEELQPYKDSAMFWHAIWVSAGKPMNSELHQIMKRTRNIFHYQIRKCKRAANMIKKNSFLQACLGNKDLDLFKLVKEMRKSEPTIACTIDGKTEEIPEHFADKYRELYNSVHDEEEIAVLSWRINRRINSSSVEEVNKITSSVIADAVSHLKPDKSDPIFKFTSDCIINAPNSFYDQLAYLFKCFLMHGYISPVLMMANLVPIVKDKLGDICSSSNYRSIAISSLLLKIFDWVVISLYGTELELDERQFSYQPGISTNMCTWMVTETVDFFTRNGSEVFLCAMDMSKAFDRVKHSTLFNKLLDRGLPEIYLRLLLVMYREQCANVKWNGQFSHEFPLTNGVKQGAVLSAILFCVYMNDLYRMLRKNRSGCWIGGEYYGIIGYSDDIVLLAPTIDALREMLKTCEEYAVDHNLQFSTHPDPQKSKTKCMAFTLRKNRNTNSLMEVTLCNNKLPWVNSLKHLGSVITNAQNIVTDDTMQKRAIYINRNNELCQEFYFAHPRSKVDINNIYNTSFYGCVLWNLFGAESERIEKTWNISVRKLLDLPRNTHRVFIEPLSRTRHIIFSLYSRYINFISQILKCQKKVLTNLLRLIKKDCRSRTGANLRNIMLKTKISNISQLDKNLIRKLKYMECTEQERWKIEFANELINCRHGALIVAGFTNAEIDSIKDYICTM